MIAISVVRNTELHERIFKQNPFLKEGKVLSFNNEIGAPVPYYFNQFIDSYDYAKEDWFVFCHDDWELLEEIGDLLDGLDKTKIYGPIGAILLTEDKRLVREFRGGCFEKNRNGLNQREILCWRHWTGLDVDTLDGQCIIVHSNLVRQFNLRFDENLEFDLYVEDFCIRAKLNYGIQSKIANFKCCHWSQIEENGIRKSYYEKLPYLNNKFKDSLLGGVVSVIGGNPRALECLENRGLGISSQSRSLIYQTDIPKFNDARRYCIDWIDDSRNLTVLDIGCACGDFVRALVAEKKVRAWGMEYDNGSIDIAKESGNFEEIFQVNLEDFSLTKFHRFFGFFDYIVIGDVLEHLREPSGVLEKLKVLIKPEGQFLISLPNITHASIKAEILSNTFNYTDVGILDRTHLRFFTHTTLPAFFGNLSLRILEMKVTTMSYKGFQPSNTLSFLPYQVKKFILLNDYSYVCQFVMKVVIDYSMTFEQLAEINRVGLALKAADLPPDLLKLKKSAIKKELPWLRSITKTCAAPIERFRYKMLAKICFGEKKKKYLEKLHKS